MWKSLSAKGWNMLERPPHASLIVYPLRGFVYLDRWVPPFLTILLANSFFGCSFPTFGGIWLMDGSLLPLVAKSKHGDRAQSPLEVVRQQYRQLW